MIRHVIFNSGYKVKRMCQYTISGAQEWKPRNLGKLPLVVDLTEFKHMPCISVRELEISVIGVEKTNI